MVGMKKNPLFSVLGVTMKFKESRLKVFIGRVVKRKEGTTMTGAQRYPTNTLTELHLVEVGENVD